ncbi:protein kinase domain-containing protein [Nocardia takedensis]|uniref:serine/threonine-protein kinase n=1 Tax=Nocardia takedensis TaxID=259390 RepID=UPI0002DAAD68|nr:serine/threonine-protein kinase [Nocardia takedensis]
MSLRPGEVFAGYRIVRRIGSGGMGAVYLAAHPRLPRRDALKILDSALAADEEFRARFRREAELAARLEHPNVVAIYDRGVENDVLWIAMRYVDGVDVAELIRRGPATLPPARTVRILADAARGLDAAHRGGLLHRDVKPANILVSAADDGADVVRITDFGIARSLDAADTTLTAGGAFPASFAYAAPEQLTGAPLDHRVDVYALGCTLYQMLTGTVPFGRRAPGAIIHAHLYEPPPRPTAAVPGLPAALDEVVARAMAKNPDHRYASCGELAAAALRAVESSGPGAGFLAWPDADAADRSEPRAGFGQALEQGRDASVSGASDSGQVPPNRSGAVPMSSATPSNPGPAGSSGHVPAPRGSTPGHIAPNPWAGESSGPGFARPDPGMPATGPVSSGTASEASWGGGGSSGQGPVTGPSWGVLPGGVQSGPPWVGGAVSGQGPVTGPSWAGSSDGMPSGPRVGSGAGATAGQGLSASRIALLAGAVVLIVAAVTTVVTLRVVRDDDPVALPTTTTAPTGTTRPSATATTAAPTTTVSAAAAWGPAAYIVDAFPGLLPADPAAAGYQGMRCALNDDQGAWLHCPSADDDGISVNIRCDPSRRPVTYRRDVTGYANVREERWTRPTGTGSVRWASDSIAGFGLLDVAFDDPARSFCTVGASGGRGGQDVFDSWWVGAPI